MSDDAPSEGIRYFNMGPWPVFVGFTTSEEAFAKEMERLKIEGVNFLARERSHATVHILERSGSLTFIIAIEPFNPRRATREMYAALIAHEAMHVIQEMQTELAKGETLGKEAKAYLIQQIVQECLQDAWASNKTRATEPE